MLIIDSLCASVEGKPVLNGVSLHIKEGTVHALMGPNGAGKSTLSRVLAGDPAYEVTSGEVLFEGKNLLELEPEERAALGIFVSFQYPVEVPGVTNFEFLQEAHRSVCPSYTGDFSSLLEEKMASMEMSLEFSSRFLNTGFSGGEKKKNEMLQLKVLQPKVAVLDETDSGLDIDAMRLVATSVCQFLKEEGKKRALLLITHYQRLLDYIPPDYVHVMMGGRIVRSEGADFVLELEKRGYDWLTQ